MFTSRDLARSPIIFKTLSVAFLTVLVVGAIGQQPGRRPRRKGPSVIGAPMPFPLIQRHLDFKMTSLEPRHWALEVGEFAMLPRGFGKLLKAPQPVVFLEYGHYRSSTTGIGRIYETKAVPGSTPEAFTKLVMESGAFRDIQNRPGFQMKCQLVAGVFIGVTTGDPGIMPLVLESLRTGK